MATPVDWPTVNDVVTWMRSETIGFNPENTRELAGCLDAARDVIEGWLDPDAMPADTAKCWPSVALAIKIRSIALFMRRDSPTGVMMVSPESVFRINRMDADVEGLIGRYRAPVIG